MHARDWHFFRHFLHDANPPYTQEEIDRYIEAWSQPGAAAGMINYYRASVRQSQKEAVAKLRPISAPTLVIWGERDAYLGSELAEPEHDDVRTSTGWSASPTPRTGSTTTRLAVNQLLSTSSAPPVPRTRARASLGSEPGLAHAPGRNRPRRRHSVVGMCRRQEEEAWRGDWA